MDSRIFQFCKDSLVRIEKASQVVKEAYDKACSQAGHGNKFEIRAGFYEECRDVISSLRYGSSKFYLERLIEEETKNNEAG